jgi:hypothetical protein
MCRECDPAETELGVKRRQVVALCLCVLLAVVFAGCGLFDMSVSDTPDVAGDSEAQAPQTESSGAAEPLQYPEAPQTDSASKAAVFVCAAPSMMGFADWNYDTVYETTVSLLSDTIVATGKPTKFYRYDGYDIDLGRMQIENAEALKAAVHDRSFYAFQDFDMNSTIPVGSKPTNYDDTSALVDIPSWFSKEGEVAVDGDADLSSSEYPLSNAIKHFDESALNVVVTDLYELRKGQPAEVLGLQGYNVGILAVKSEFSGYLPEYIDKKPLIWGSAPKGSYGSFSTKTRNSQNPDGTLKTDPEGNPITYSYKIFKPIDDSGRICQQRSFYILFAGSGDITKPMNDVSKRLQDKYSDSSGFDVTQEKLVISSLYADAVCDLETVALTDDPFYLDLGFGNKYPDAYCYEISHGGGPSFEVSVDYPQNKEVDGRDLTEKAFETVTDIRKSTGDGMFAAVGSKTTIGEPTLSVSANEANDRDVRISLAYDFGSLEKGVYIFETHMGVLPPERSEDALGSWNIDTNDGLLHSLISEYDETGEAPEGLSKALQGTIGLSANLINPLIEAADKKSAGKSTEIFAIRICLEVV